MSKWNTAIEITFNDNDGKVGHSYIPDTCTDLHRHWCLFGFYRTRWILFKQFWKALKRYENYTEQKLLPEWHKIKLWNFKQEIPE